MVLAFGTHLSAVCCLSGTHNLVHTYLLLLASMVSLLNTLRHFSELFSVFRSSVAATRLAWARATKHGKEIFGARPAAILKTERIVDSSIVIGITYSITLHPHPYSHILYIVHTFMHRRRSNHITVEMIEICLFAIQRAIQSGIIIININKQEEKERTKWIEVEYSFFFFFAFDALNRENIIFEWKQNYFRFDSMSVANTEK